MAHFSLETALSKTLKLDAPLTKGPTARWERKESESTMTTNSNAVIVQGNKTPFKGSNTGKTPTKTPAKTPAKTPGKKTESKKLGSAKKMDKTPKKTPKTPNNAGDRFIPNRAATQFELGYFKLMQNDKENGEMASNNEKYHKAMSENLNGGDINAARIIHYNANKPPVAPDGYLNNLRVLYSQTKTPGSVRKSTRHIPSGPERVLDAPEIINDYYLNLLDWSTNNHIALCLLNTVYLWNASNGEIQQLMCLDGPIDYVASVAWIQEGTHIALGTSDGFVQLWDVSALKRIRKMGGHSTRVSSLSWNSYIISSGSRNGNIHHYDVRVPEHHVASSNRHTQEVCGLRWSLDGRYLASGANDNLLNVWAAGMDNKYSESSPLHTFTLHQAAVKALSWCPWQNGILASGGGTSDRTIRFWNINNGVCLNSIDTKSQVCGILWSREYKEIISGHGFANNQMIIWKYPTMQRIAELNGHSSRILQMAMSPDGSCVASVAADETLRLWRCFPIDLKKSTSKTQTNARCFLKQSIR